MYLLDTNIIRYFGEGHPNLKLHLEKISWSNIALPSTVVAEILKGRSSFALTSTPNEAPLAHSLLLDTYQFLTTFNVILFDKNCSRILIELRDKYKHHKRYADMMIAATAIQGKHVVVTRNIKHFSNYLPKSQLENWIDNKPVN